MSRNRARIAGLSLALVLLLFSVAPVSAQTVVRYGAEFLAGGVGGRALGMGGAHVGLAQDVSAGYWNPAGLARITHSEVGYMHAERFAGIVSFDYAGGVFPLNDRSAVGISFFRSGVNDIKNTLDAWDSERDRPKSDPGSHITTFSAADYAFFFSYGRRVNDALSAGVTAKVIRRNIGHFASAWGYSFDVAAQYTMGGFTAGATLQDASTMLQTWSVNQDALRPIEEDFGEVMPEGGTELVLPLMRLGAGYTIPMGMHAVTVAADVDLAFDGQKTYAANMGEVSFHPRLGAEYVYRNLVALRAGINRLATDGRGGADIVPTVGAGLILDRISIDYGFGDFAGIPSELGFSHRIAASMRFGTPIAQR